MKILILQDDFPPYENGGAGVMAHLIAKSLVAQGQEVFVITTVQKKELVGTFQEGGMTIRRIYSNYHERWRSYRSLYNWQTISEIKRILHEVQPDIVHAHNIHYHLSYHSLKIAKKYTDKVFITTHDIMPFYQGTFTEFIKTGTYKVTWPLLFKAFRKRFNPFHNMLVRYYLSFTQKIIAVSNELKNALEQNNIKNIVVIHNGVEVREASYQNSFKVLFQGRLSGAKGGAIVLNVMEQVIKEIPQAKLLVVGKKDAYAERMLKKANDMGIAENIVFTGWLSDMQQAYIQAAVVVVPSVCFDSFPNGNLEAFANKRPVIATCFGGSKEIVQDGVNGYIVNPFEIDVFSQKLIDLLKNPEKAKQFGENGFALVKKEFSLERMVRDYLALFHLIDR